ncbi:hypothetical protein BABINDRAFT_172650 [Babjeviella inositovora NRRL Y-12698]|uniref:Mitochondrial carrier protein n=1 Tax=Babjeviella inositovora NRRL Y-12698 TaxID=984486 RepID=A0A1E3QLM3_9ASCO|nr:uncharacterized protein BABINDRAFT_172650 [Babjeviella inositovora NRRL Y-12698]ODQ77887.1 hypothetical protein BABINDRAFT_172650 [Babjeviella inositovora NRRL Y-12698]
MVQSRSPAPTQQTQLQKTEITLGQRMISACLGSIITSGVVTPFDVIRIRIQQQEVLPSGVCCGAGSPVAPITGRNTLVKAVPVSASPTDVFWMLKDYCQPGTNQHHPQCLRIDSTLRGFINIPKHEGLATLWRGLSLTLIMAVPSNVIYYSGYEYCRDHSPLYGHALNPLFCGSISRTLAATCISPLELLKTRFQSIPNESKASKSSDLLKSLLRDMRTAVQQKGLGTLFTGLGLTLWRDVPFSGIYWFSYEHLKSSIGDSLRRRTAASSGESTALYNENKNVLISSFLSGSMAGAVAALFTNPFDVGKTRLQLMSQKQLASPGTIARPPASVMTYILKIYHKEGMRALYSGFTPRVIKIAPACAIMISTYEIGKKVFERDVVADGVFLED